MKNFSMLAGLIVLFAFTRPMLADGIGLSIFGNLSVPSAGSSNYFDSAALGVPPGYGNSTTNGTVVIGSGIEFAATNFQDLFTVDFTGTTVTLTDTCVSAGCGTTPFTATFYSPYITGYTTDSFNFPGATVSYGYDAAYGGNVGTLVFAGSNGFTGGTAVFDYSSVAPPAAVPEPSTLGLVVTGLASSAGAIRRRFKA